MDASPSHAKPLPTGSLLEVRTRWAQRPREVLGLLQGPAWHQLLTVHCHHMLQKCQQVTEIGH